MTPIKLMIRTDSGIVERLDVLVDLVAATPEYAANKVTKSMVHRMALLAGIEALEDKYALAKKR